MTKHEAADITIEVWSYLRDHPEIDDKTFLPYSLYEKIECLPGRCALCMVNIGCAGCPLSENSCGDYWSWRVACSSDVRASSAAIIVEKTIAWKTTPKEGE